MRTIFVDRVIELHHRRRVVTQIEFPAEEEVFAHHFPANPILPASLIMECFAHAGTILLEVSSTFTLKAIPGYIQNAKFHRPIRPVAPVTIEMETESWSDEAAVLRGRASQAEVRCSTCTLGMVTAPLGQFFGPEHAALYRGQYERWLEHAELSGFESPPLEELRHALAR
jgi:3-hydroxymyristoyl/3-hydroxydecanoyl-(acyl carrier protein) dehydratase